MSFVPLLYYFDKDEEHILKEILSLDMTVEWIKESEWDGEITHGQFEAFNRLREAVELEKIEVCE